MLTHQSEMVRMAGSRMDSTALNMLLLSGLLERCAEAVEAEKVGLASAMTGSTLYFRNRLHTIIDIQLPEYLMQMIFHGV